MKSLNLLFLGGWRTEFVTLDLPQTQRRYTGLWGMDLFCSMYLTEGIMLCNQVSRLEDCKTKPGFWDPRISLWKHRKFRVSAFKRPSPEGPVTQTVEDHARKQRCVDACEAAWGTVPIGGGARSLSGCFYKFGVVFLLASL